MSIYFIEPNENYLEKISDYLINYHFKNFSNITVIVPNTIACSSLQQLLVKNIRHSASFLPNIVPISSFSKEGEFSYKMPNNSIEVASSLEQKLILIDIIQKYSAINFGFLQSSYLSEELLRLFQEFEYWDINVETLSEVVEIDSAEHWIKITHFIKYSYYQWKERLKEQNKVDQVTYQKIAIKIASSNIKNTTILVGIVTEVPFLKDFIKNLVHSKNGIVILPPFYKDSIKKELSHISPFYKLKELVKYANVSIENLQRLPSNKLYNISSKVEYIKTTDLLEEAEVIALIVANSPKNEKIGIVTNNNELINLCSIALSKYGISANNLHGIELINTKHAEFVLLVSEAVITRDIIKFIALLKTPFLISSDIYRFDITYFRKSSIDTIEKLVETIDAKNKDDINMLNSFLEKTYELYSKISIKSSFQEMIQAHMQVVTNLVPNIWNSEEGRALYKFFTQLINIAHNMEFIDSSFYPNIIKEFLSKAKFFATTSDSTIYILSAGDAILLEIDSVILADCNNGSIPKSNIQDPWMSNKMRKAILLPSTEEAISTEHYYFSLLLSKNNVFITRSTKNSSIESRFVTEFLLENNNLITNSYSWHNAIISIFKESYKDSITSVGFSHLMPSSISATNIELLIRNPYIFYAKNILGLKKIDEINKEVSLADFGTLIHNIIALYTEDYSQFSTFHIQDKLNRLISIGKELFKPFCQHRKYRAWWEKFTDIASGFIEWDEQRRNSISEIYSEIYGETILSIGENNIKITAIADRLEYTKSGDLQIIDYKTGIVPSKQDVLRGLSPQLIIESIIALDGGFKQIKKFNNVVLTYVKVTNSKQSYNETSIEISKTDITHHKQGLITVLKHYINSGIFPSNADSIYSPKYNDYKHLERNNR